MSEDECRGVGLNSICQYCGCHMIEVEGEVYVGLRGWMCESCYLGDQKPHCMPRPYKKR